MTELEYLKSVVNTLRKIKQDLIETARIRRETRMLEKYEAWIRAIKNEHLELEEFTEICEERQLILRRAANNEDFNDIIERRLKWWKWRRRLQLKRHRHS